MPKELISRFVKLCPTCQVRRGTSRNSPPVSVKSLEASTEAQSPDTYSVATSRKNSTVSGHTATSTSFPLQRAGFKASSTFQQQNRWMTPLQPPNQSNSVSPTTMHNPTSRHDSYSTIPPMTMSCNNGNPSVLSFSAINSYGNNDRSSSAYTSSSLSHPTNGHVSTGTSFDIKANAHYI